MQRESQLTHANMPGVWPMAWGGTPSGWAAKVRQQRQNMGPISITKLLMAPSLHAMTALVPIRHSRCLVNSTEVTGVNLFGPVYNFAYTASDQVNETVARW